MQYFSQLAILAAFLMPIKLSIAYCVAVPGLLLWVLDKRARREPLFSDLPSRAVVPFAVWIAIVFASSIFGINGWRTLHALGTLVMLALLPAFFCSAIRAHGVEKLLAALFLGQAITSFHTVCQGYLPASMHNLFVGTLSESGQLALTSVLAFGFLFLVKDGETVYKRDLFTGAINFLLLSLVGLKQNSVHHLVLIATAVIFLYSIIRSFKAQRSEKYSPAITLLLIPLLCAALVINLKRGPWLGVLSGSLLLLVSIGRKRFTVIVGTAALVILLVAPVRDRLLASYQHFVLAGGRMTMWEVGLELAAKFPLGIGYKNSRFMRQLDPEIPPAHSHFHSNWINILAETGWLGLGCMVWWFAQLLLLSFGRYPDRRTTLLARTSGAALVSWQVAGLVEYNFGDVEVLMIAYLVMGVLAAAILQSKRHAIAAESSDLSLAIGASSDSRPILKAAR